MKQFFQRILSPGLYGKLASFRRRSAKQLQKFTGIMNRSLNVALYVLPVSSLLHLKSKIQIVRKLDYQRREIFLKVDSYETEYLVRLHSCKKETETVQWIENFMRPGEVFYDIGANIGAYSLIAAKYYEGTVRIFAFEPSSLNYAKLCENIRLNACQAMITPLSIALSDVTKVHGFHYGSWQPGAALHTLTEAPEPDAFPVLSSRLDDLIEAFSLPAPNHLKLDVDGLELSILRGAEKAVRSIDVKSIILEMRQGDSEEAEISRFLEENNFEIHSKHFHRDAETGEFTKTYNCIFYRKGAFADPPTLK